MRRPFSYLAAVVILALAALVSFRAALRGHSPAGSASPPVVADARTSAGVEGPYFSDRDRVGERIISAINGSRETIDAAMYSLTEPAIAAALEAASRRGVRLRIVADADQTLDRYSQIPYLREAGIPVRLSGGYRGERSLMHDKFAVFDGRLAVTGSFNWTTSADDFNYENAIFIADPSIAARFENEFARIWARAR